VRLYVILFVAFGCGSERAAPSEQAKPEPARVAPRPDPYKHERERMVERTIIPRGVSDERVLEAMRHVPRHELVPLDVREEAYADRPLPIGFDKTISQPYIVAAMTAAVKLRPGDRVLEIGTGSGYQAAVLAELSAEVYTIEISEPLAKRAERDLVRIGYKDVHVRAGDGHRGWPDAAPFDAIIVTAAASTVPEALFEQLAIGGRMVIPLGTEDEQYLTLVTRLRGDRVVDPLFPVRFGQLLGGP
jgi:protein-L-isoaspartate(D-aspartate) O-methyltransferase